MAWEGGTEQTCVLDGYSWAELAGIAEEMAACSNASEARGIARRRGICANGVFDGSLRKSLELKDGTSCVAQIVDFRHDARSDGTGFAGTTWCLDRAIATHSFDDSVDVWEAADWSRSSLRQYLNARVMGLLPNDLQSVVAMVDKRSLGLFGEPQVKVTQDRLWAPSYSELVGAVRWFGKSQDDVNEILSMEGRQFRLFKSCGVNDRLPQDGNDALRRSHHGKACWWWLRTRHRDFKRAAHIVLKHGAIGACRKGEHCGVVPFFCI